MLERLLSWLIHNAASLTVPVLWLLVYLVRGNGRPKPIKASRKAVTLRIAVASGRVGFAWRDRREEVASQICIRGPPTQVLAIGDDARDTARAQRQPTERLVGILASELWQQLRAWPPARASTNAKAEIAVFDPFALETFSLAAIDAFVRYEVAVVTRGMSLVERWHLRRGMLALQLDVFDKLSTEQQLALIKIVSHHVATVSVNDRAIFRV